MSSLFAPPSSHGPALFIAALAIGAVVALLNGALDRLWGSRRRAAMLMSVAAAATASGVMLRAVGFSIAQSVAFPALAAPVVLALFFAKWRLRRALHLPA